MPASRTRRRFLAECAGLAALTTACATPPKPSAAAARRPNIVLLLADDLGYGDVGCYGAADVRTPAIDGLAREGVRFTSYYCNAPECTPTRTALLTGRYQQRVGGLECAIGIGSVGRYDDAERLAAAGALGLPAEETSLARMLKNAGYATGLAGKWHLGYSEKFSPGAHGFDHAFYALGGGLDYFHHTEPDGLPVLRLNGAPVQREGYFTDLITDEAVGFLRRQAGAPFFLYVPYTAPHAPYQGPNDPHPKSLTDAEWNTGTRETLAAMVERMDQGLARILEALDETGRAPETIVLFLSDNGGTKLSRNGPYRGGKSQLFEGGLRVPCVVRWPGVYGAGVEAAHPVMTFDVTRTLLAAAGAQPPAGRALDGLDVLRPEGPRDRTLFWRYRRGEATRRAAREDALKYIVNAQGPTIEEFLFDLDRDPQEQNNLLADRPRDVAHLRQLLAAWEADVRPVR